MRAAAAAMIAMVLAASSAGAQDRSPDLATALRLRPDQQAAYAAYLKATAPDESSEARRRDEAGRLPQWTTPQRLDWTRAQVAADLAVLDAEAPAVKRFYGQLTPTQRRTFDAATAPAGDR